MRCTSSARSPADRGDFKASAEYTREALAILRGLLGDEHPAGRHGPTAAGDVAAELGPDRAGARPKWRRRAWPGRRTMGSHHRHVAGATMILAGVLARSGQHDEALAQFDRALAIFEATGGPQDPEAGLALNNRGLALRQAGRFEDSERDLQRALAIRTEVFGPKHPKRGRDGDQPREPRVGPQELRAGPGASPATPSRSSARRSIPTRPRSGSRCSTSGSPSRSSNAGRMPTATSRKRSRCSSRRSTARWGWRSRRASRRPKRWASASKPRRVASGRCGAGWPLTKNPARCLASAEALCLALFRVRDQRR